MRVLRTPMRVPCKPASVRSESRSPQLSLTDYVLVSQDRARIEHFARASDGRWVYTAANAGERIELSSGTVLDIDAIFAGVVELPGD